ncbi:MAG: hypothetical protein BJ554DRAFT_8187 [Olpidium bornovanus]|uniref:Uncharacterized protein n=1 Tax=Olpidium bornovanus TaxID=278681 RepID=A0A8H7ZVC2_9FUNG|nr:MAG: hypothetical protein BJ554DRAFT_8187 [Olpidium bornovanus]
MNALHIISALLAVILTGLFPSNSGSGLVAALPPTVVYRPVTVEQLKEPQFWPNYNEPRRPRARPLVKPTLTQTCEPLGVFLGIDIYDGHIAFFIGAALIVMIGRAAMIRRPAVERRTANDARQTAVRCPSNLTLLRQRRPDSRRSQPVGVDEEEGGGHINDEPNQVVVTFDHQPYC